eukprot:Seg4968.2 transcript_id=Seg4968.2/GoldUCD/mRNA.D3Y31 product="hypothetical protein" protein_id=Seg4968.2/GoldUCD/D3Y31
MEQASGPSHPNTEVGGQNPKKNDLHMIQLALDESNDELLEEVYNEEDDDDDTISNGSNNSDILFSLKEIEIGHDQITQTTAPAAALQENLNAALHENSALKAEIADNKSEIQILKNKISGLEKNITTFQKQLDDLSANQEKSAATKTADCPLAKSLKDVMLETKSIVLSIQEEKFDKKTAEKNSDKLFRKNVQEINLEIENTKDQIQKSADKYEKLLASITEIKKSIRENANTLKRVTEKEGSVNNRDEKVLANPTAINSFSNPRDPPFVKSPQEPSVRLRNQSGRWTSPLQEGNHHDDLTNVDISSYLIGDSILKGILTRKLDYSRSTKVRTLRGKQLRDVRNVLAAQDLSSLRNLIIHIGTNDIPKQTGDKIVEQFQRTINEITTTYPNLSIYISTILPREDLKTTGSAQKINYVNDQLKGLSSQLNFKVIDNASNLEDPKLRYDGLHLTEKGTAILSRNFKDAFLPQRNYHAPRFGNINRNNGKESSCQHSEISQTHGKDPEVPSVPSMQSSFPMYYNQHSDVTKGFPGTPAPLQQYPAQWPLISMQATRSPSYPQNGTYTNPWYQFNNMPSPYTFQPRQFGMPVPVF